jgi:hypothetical protein
MLIYTLWNNKNVSGDSLWLRKKPCNVGSMRKNQEFGPSESEQGKRF